MSPPRSTPRLHLTVGVLSGVVALVAVSERGHAGGIVGELLSLAGLALIACSALGRAWSSVFIAGFKDRTLVRDGPYSALRHPLYACSLLGMLGAGLATGSLAITAALLLVFGVVYAGALRTEDRFLSERHGEAHARFRRELRALLPRWSRYRVPEALEVRPRVLWKAFVDAGSLLGLYLLIRGAHAAQQAGLTPTWLTLP
jgi:protein-S-isoprenylcysteine O-methyltransferase Ste14